MDRLTKWDENHGWQENHDHDTREWKNGSRACMEKLAAYEDTGLSPAEVATLRDEVTRLKAKVNKLNQAAYNRAVDAYEDEKARAWQIGRG